MSLIDEEDDGNTVIEDEDEDVDNILRKASILVHSQGSGSQVVLDSLKPPVKNSEASSPLPNNPSPVLQLERSTSSHVMHALSTTTGIPVPSLRNNEPSIHKSTSELSQPGDFLTSSLPKRDWGHENIGERSASQPLLASTTNTSAKITAKSPTILTANENAWAETPTGTRSITFAKAPESSFSSLSKASVAGTSLIQCFTKPLF